MMVSSFMLLMIISSLLISKRMHQLDRSMGMRMPTLYFSKSLIIFSSCLNLEWMGLP